MTIDQGMNIAEVKALGETLKSIAGKLDGIAQQLNSKVGSTTWVGSDAVRFKNDWWPGHRTRLQQVRADLDGFGQSALNNASEQEKASSEGGVGPVGLVAPAIIGIGGTILAPSPGGADPTPSTTPQAPASGSGPGAQSGELPGSHRSWEEVQKEYDAKYRGYGLWTDGAPGGENQYQCVSWAWYRMKELGYTGPQVSADGGQMAAALGGSTGTAPHLGAVMSYGNHVVVAEQVTTLPDGRLSVRFSEMNSGNDGSGWKNASPSEYRSDQVMVQNPNGTWSIGNGNLGSVTVFNPSYP
jgi:hypothetical protein